MYSIDSGALIDAWVRKYPPDFLPSLWDAMHELADAGTIVSPEEVLLELQRGDDELFAWASDRHQMFFPPTADIQARVAHIVNTFPAFLPERAADGIWADPYVIALAQDVGGAVVTSELVAPDNARQTKIPNICDQLDVRCLTPLEFFLERGWRF